MMSWLRSSQAKQNIYSSSGYSNEVRHRSPDATASCDPKACYDSFCIHWQQAHDIILKSNPQRSPIHDDVLGVVSHLDYMVTLLLVELHQCNKMALPNVEQTPSAPCLEYLLSENLLDKLYEWGITTGRYANAIRLELLKLFELLVSHSRHHLLVHEPFLRPLLKILASSQGEIFPTDVEKRLVLLLNQLCVVLMQNIHLLDLFFFSSNQQQEQGKANFILFSLLIPFVHRDGSLGHQARDALLLCMALSQKNSNVGVYIAQYSSICPLLVTGLGGLYSRLPNSIEISSIDWYRITPDDVTKISELTLFINSLEFCNAVVQVAHNLIKIQLLDFIYQGFIVPVLGPAILQLCMVMLSFFDTLLSLYCEDIMLELLLKYLLPGKHVPISYRHQINHPDSYVNTVEFFLNLTPDIMKHSTNLHNLRISDSHNLNNPVAASFSRTIGANWNHYGLHSGDSLYSNYHAYLFDAHQKIVQCHSACIQWSNKYKYKIIRNSNNQLPEKVTKLIRNFYQEFSDTSQNSINVINVDEHNSSELENNSKLDSLKSTGDSSGYDSFKWRPNDEHAAMITGCDYYCDSTLKKTELVWKATSKKESSVVYLDFSEDIFSQGTATLGPFLSCIWSKLQTFTSNSLFVNLHLTGIITKLALYPLPLLHSILLRPDIIISSDSPSFHQILRILKQQIDAELSLTEDSLEIIDDARLFLIDREFRLISARKNATETQKNTSIPQLTPSLSYDTFRRNDAKKKSFSQSITKFFKMPSSTSFSFSSFSAFNNHSQGLMLLNMDSRTGANSGNNSVGGGSSSEPTSLDSLSSMTSTIGTIAVASGNDRTRDLALCAVLLDEWLKELAAVSQEQYIVMLNDIF